MEDVNNGSNSGSEGDNGSGAGSSSSDGLVRNPDETIDWTAFGGDMEVLSKSAAGFPLVMKTPNTIELLAFSPSTRAMALSMEKSGHQSPIILYDTAAGQKYGIVHGRDNDIPTACVFTHTGNYVVSGYESGAVMVFDHNEKTVTECAIPTADMETGYSCITLRAITGPGSPRVFSIHCDGHTVPAPKFKMTMWDIPSAKSIWSVAPVVQPNGTAGNAFCGDISNDGSIIVCVRTRTLSVAPVDSVTGPIKSGGASIELDNRFGRIACVHVSSDASKFALQSSDGNYAHVTVWNTSLMKVIYSLQIPDGFRCATFAHTRDYFFVTIYPSNHGDDTERKSKDLISHAPIPVIGSKTDVVVRIMTAKTEAVAVCENFSYPNMLAVVRGDREIRMLQFITGMAFQLLLISFAIDTWSMATHKKWVHTQRLAIQAILFMHAICSAANTSVMPMLPFELFVEFAEYVAAG